MKARNTNKRIIRMKDLPSKTGFQPSTIYELISKGKFPAPFKLIVGGRAAGWLENTVDDWIAAQAEHHELVSSK